MREPTTEETNVRQKIPPILDGCIEKFRRDLITSSLDIYFQHFYGYDEDKKFFFVTYSAPQIIICFLNYEYKWSLHIGDKCCLSLPIRFCKNSYIVSGGCDGLVYRIDLKGKVMEKIRPFYEKVSLLDEIVRCPENHFSVSNSKGRTAIIDSNFRHIFTDLINKSERTSRRALR
jgi:hypothetical protein